jgi:hypothetical protein
MSLRPALLFALLAALPVRAGAQWVADVDPAGPGEPLSPALLGHYDLSGSLFAYDQVPGLAGALAPAGFAGWRLGAGRWESNTWRLPALTNGTPCPLPLPQAFAPSDATDLDLIAARDWFTDDGDAVSLADTQDDARYALAYLRSALDVASALGAEPFVSLDLMPRALAANRTPLRTHCDWSYTNRVSNVRPADAAVFAAAAAGLVRRVVEGSAGEPGRAVTHWEIWNEPELPFFWDPAFEDLAGPLDRFLSMAVQTLVQLHLYRTGSAHPNAAELRFGLAGFAHPETAAAVLAGFDALQIPGVGAPPLDFVSFHAYSNDPLAIVAAIETVAAAAAASAHYGGVELVLSEWGPSLSMMSDAGYASSMDPALVIGTALALGAAAGLDRAHHTFFWDFYPSNAVTFGVLDHALAPRPLHRAYQLLARLVGGGADRLAPAGLPDGRFEGGLGAVLVARDGAGAIRALFVNRNATARTARLERNGAPATPDRLLVLDDPAGPVHDAAVPGADFTLPPRSLVLAELDAPSVPALGPPIVALTVVLLAAEALRARR